jgi:hypothetical protein
VSAEPDVLQHRDWLDHNPCFGCGPTNDHGIQIETTIDAEGVGHATWMPEGYFQGPPGAVNGGLVAVPMDCHGNWTAINAFRARAVEQGRDPSVIAGVTGTYTVRLSAPTPIEGPIELRAEVTELDGRKAHVTVAASHDGTVTATFTGVFFEVDQSVYGG